MKKYITFLIILLAVAFIVPSVALAAWWNPMTWHWGWLNSIFHFQQTQQKTQQQTTKTISENDLKSVTLSYPNPYDESKTDSFNLKNNRAVIYNSGNAMPRSYTLAKTATGDLDGDGVNDGALAVYQGFGANIIRPVIFAVLNKSGVLTQADSALPLPDAYDAQIKNLSINNGIITLSLLVVSDQDMKNKPHVEWKPSVGKNIQYKLVNGKLVEQTTNQNISWKTYTNKDLGIEFKYPSDWTAATTVKNDYNYDGAVLTPPNMPNNYNIIYVGKIDCQSITQQHPGKIDACKKIGTFAVYDRMGADEANSNTSNIIDQIISTFKFITPAPVSVAKTPEQKCVAAGGKVSTVDCYCSGTQDFYNNCLVGACACPPNPQFKKEVKICDCGQGKCWDGTKCTTPSY